MHNLHIGLTGYTMLRVFMVWIALYIVRTVCQNKVQLSIEFLSDDKTVRLRQIYEVHFDNGGQGNYRFDEFGHCSPLIFPQCRTRDGITLIHDVFSYLVHTSAGSRLQPKRPVLMFVSSVCTYIMRYLSDLDNFILCSGSPHPDTENRRDIFLYNIVNAGCESSRINWFSTSSGVFNFIEGG